MRNLSKHTLCLELFCFHKLALPNNKTVHLKKEKKEEKTIKKCLHAASGESSVASVLPQLKVSLFSNLLLQLFSLRAIQAFFWGLQDHLQPLSGFYDAHSIFLSLGNGEGLRSKLMGCNCMNRHRASCQQSQPCPGFSSAPASEETTGGC